MTNCEFVTIVPHNILFQYILFIIIVNYHYHVSITYFFYFMLYLWFNVTYYLIMMILGWTCSFF